MAIAQRPSDNNRLFAVSPYRPAVKPGARSVRKPEQRRGVRSGSRLSIAPFVKPILFAATLASFFVAYVSGHAQMTSAAFQATQLKREQGRLLNQRQALENLRQERENHLNVEQWAKSRGMVKYSGAPLLLNEESLNKVTLKSASVSAKDSSASRDSETTSRRTGSRSDGAEAPYETRAGAAMGRR